MDFTIIDAVVAAVIIISALLAFSRGLVRETLAIGGWVVAAVVAYIFAPQAEPLMKEVPVLADLIDGNCAISMIAAFAAVFALGLLVMSIFTPLFSSMVQRSAMGGLDQALGFLFGVLRGILLVAIGFILYEYIVVSRDVAMVEGSQSIKVFEQLQERLEEKIPETAPAWITERYEALLAKCDGGTPVEPVTPEAPAPTAN